MADKEPQDKLMEAIRTNYNYRYDEICHHWGSNILGPKLVACVAKLEEAKAKEEKCTLLSFPHQKSLNKISFKKKKEEEEE